MNEMRKTIAFGGIAAILLLLALVTTPKRVPPDQFFDEGEAFFPEFVDPNSAQTLEVIEWSEETGTAVPFKVTFSDGRWTIPSHYGYPADGKEQLAKTAAGLIDITKDDFRTDNAADHEACGVIDPLDDANPTAEGRGQRVTIKGENDVVLADLIIGKSFEGRENFRLVRVPGQKRVYGTKIDLAISTKFKDWIEPDLMLIEATEIDKVTLFDYSIDEQTSRLDQRDEVPLTRSDEEKWDVDNIPADKIVDDSKVNNLVSAIDQLAIEGVRPKPEGLSASLSATGSGGVSITQADMLSLRSKGFYFTGDGRLVSNEGELQVRTKDGVSYTLRFGEVVFGSGLAVSAGGTAIADEGEPGENRYLMITTSFNPALFPEPARPANTDFSTKPDSLWNEEDYRMKGLQTAHDNWQRNIDAARARSEELNARFAAWYYVISAESFDKLHLKRVDILKDKPQSS